jgi:hypothetical protein
MSRTIWALLLVLSLTLFPTVSAFSMPTIGGSSSSGLWGGIFNVNSSDTPVYAAFFALMIIIVLYQVLQRTMLSGGAAGIAWVFGAILFVFLFTNPQFIQIFLGISVGIILMSFLAVALLIPRKYGSSSMRGIGAIILLIMFYLVVSNNSSISSALTNVAGINIKGILPVIVVGAIILGIVFLLIKAFKSTKSRGMKLIIPIVILGLLVFFFLPGAGAFLLSPLSLIFYGVLVAGIVIWLWFFAGKSGLGASGFQFSPKVQTPPSTQVSETSAADTKRADWLVGAIRGEQAELRKEQTRLDSTKKAFAAGKGKQKDINYWQSRVDDTSKSLSDHTSELGKISKRMPP